MTEKLTLSFTRIKTFLQCRQKYVWIYEENLATPDKAYPLVLGDLVHQLLHEHLLGNWSIEDIQDINKVKGLMRQSYPDTSDDDLVETSSYASQLVTGYLNEFKNDPLKLIPGETTMVADLGDYLLQGRNDAWARYEDEKLWRVEFKTASRFDAAYLQGQKKGLQGGIYDFLAEKLFNEPVAGTIYNMIVKTKIPQFKRAQARCNRKTIERALTTVEGVYRSISRGDFYPSCDCYSYNRECEYMVLCEHDSPSVREQFFVPRKEL